MGDIMTKVVFMGTPEFCVPILKMLIKKYDVVGVVTQPDKEVGRKRILTPSPIKQVAIDNNIPVVTPNKIRTEFECVLKFNPDIIVTCAYGQIIPKEILDYPKYGCINVHASLLPKYRGGAPIQRAIMNGESKTGITIMYMDEGMDTGDIISVKEVTINDDDNLTSLNKKMSDVGVELLDVTLPNILSGNITRIKQDSTQATFAPIIKRQDERIDFNLSSLGIYNHIRALSDEPGAYATLDGKIVKFYSSRISSNVYPNAKTGEVVNVYKDGIGISTSDSEIIITSIKFEGKNRISVRDYLNGKDKNTILGKIFNGV